MKTADLYAGLDWGPVELLIPQKSISDASLADPSPSPARPGSPASVSIDDAVHAAFRGRLPRPEKREGGQPILVVGGVRYRTALMPKTVTPAAEGGCRPPCRILKEAFARHGLEALCFAEGKIRYIVDIQAFCAGEGR